jgi:hypothetical protein
LAEDLVEEWRSDLSAAMEGNRQGPAIGVVPPLVASGLSTLDEAELTGHPLELRAVALGIHDFGRVLGQGSAPLLILLGDHIEDVTQLRQGLFPRGHQGVTAGDGGHLGDPGTIILTIEHDLIGVEAWAVHVERIPRHGVSGPRVLPTAGETLNCP